MTDADIHAFTPADATPRPAPRLSRRWRTGLVLAGAALLLVLLAAAAAMLLVSGLGGATDNGWQLSFEGSDWAPVVVGPHHALAALLGVSLAVALVLLLVPLALLLALAGTMVGLLAAGLAVGVALLVVALAVAAGLSPLWLPGLLLWLLLRRRSAPAARMAA